MKISNHDMGISKKKVEGNHCPLKNKITSDFAWDIYNFINYWKEGDFGLIGLQDALDNRFEEYQRCREIYPKKLWQQ